MCVSIYLISVGSEDHTTTVVSLETLEDCNSFLWSDPGLFIHTSIYKIIYPSLHPLILLSITPFYSSICSLFFLCIHCYYYLSIASDKIKRIIDTTLTACRIEGDISTPLTIKVITFIIT